MVLEIMEKFSEKSVLVVGDIMLDHKISGKVTRISPEAPVPLLKITNEEFKLGGAGNVAKNIRGLGAKVTLVGVLGNDKYAMILTELCSKENINLIFEKDRINTTLKSRYYSGNHYLFRTDLEETKRISEEVKDNLLKKIKNEDFDIIIISDYNKGIITNSLIKKLKNLNLKIIMDPKPSKIEEYEGINYITPNVKELGEISRYYGLLDETKNTENYVLKSLLFLKNKISANIIVTRSEKGISFLQDKKIISIPAIPGEVLDVTGAGDSTIAIIALALASGSNLKDACVLGVVAGCSTVRKMGTVTITVDEIKKEIKDY